MDNKAAGAESIHVLLVEDNPTDVLLLEEALEEIRNSKFLLTHLKRLDEALSFLRHQLTDVVLLDLGLPDSQGLETFTRLQREYSGSPILILSGLDDEELAMRAVQDGAHDFLVKGKINAKALTRTIRYAIERKRSEQRLVASEMGFRRLFETAQDGIFLLDAPTGIITDANPFLEQLLGYPVSELIGRRLWEIAPFRDRAANQAAFATLKEKGYIRYDHLLLATRSGNYVDVEFASNVYAVGEQEVIQCNIRDVTARKQAEVQLHFQKTLLEAQAEASLDGILVVGHEGEILSYNQRFVQMWGISAQVAEQKDDGQAIVAVLDKLSSPDLFIEKVAYLYEHREESSQEEVALCDGRIFDRYSSPISSSDGTYYGRVWYFRDITERKHSERELQKLSRAVEQSPVSIVITDLAGNIEYINPHFTFLTGYSCQEVLGKNPRFLASGETPPEVYSQMWATLVAGRDWQGEFVNKKKDGTLFWELASISPVVDEAGETTHFVAVKEDITERKQAHAALQQANSDLESRVRERTRELDQVNQALHVENVERQLAMAALRESAQELRKAKEEADAANLAKSEFLSRMSHELRTPLNAILGFGQILDKPSLTASEKESVSYILKGGRHLLALINEVLDIARVEAGHDEFSIEAVALDEVVSEACSLMGPLATEAKVCIVQRQESAPHSGFVRADRQRIKQVLINLLSNAIKYNYPGGSVFLSCEQLTEETMRIAVQDTGPGIAAPDIPKLFTPFERLSAPSRNIEGTGLGLAVSHRLVTAMGGTLEVTSALDKGSTFTVELPRAPAPEETLRHARPEILQNLGRDAPDRQYSILYVEDNLSNLKLLERIVEARPHITLHSAMDGKTGLELARSRKFDLILLDLHLPDLSGKEVFNRLRHSTHTNQVPVIIVSADATPAQVQRLRDAGAVAYLTKPLDVSEILSTLDSVLDGRPDVHSQAAPASEPAVPDHLDSE